MRRLWMVLLLLTLVANALADVVCDGIDDDLTTGLDFSTFLSATTGTFMVWYKPTGTASSGGSLCADGEFIMGQQDGGSYAGLHRNGNFTGGVDRLCATNFASSSDDIATSYSVNTGYHLAWQHSGGTLLLYKDGALVSSTASSNTGSVVITARLCGGGIGGSGRPYGEGVIAGAQFFSTALSATEIAAIAGSRLRRIAVSAPSGSWELDSCGDGASCTAQTFGDRSGNGRPLTASGTTGAASTYVTYPWGVE